MGVASLTAAPRLRAQSRARNLILLVAQPAGGVPDLSARAVAPAIGQGLERFPAAATFDESRSMPLGERTAPLSLADAARLYAADTVKLRALVKAARGSPLQ